MATVVFTYLRVIVDHNGQVFANLRQREVEFCTALLREKVSETSKLQHILAVNTHFAKLWLYLAFSIDQYFEAPNFNCNY